MVAEGVAYSGIPSREEYESSSSTPSDARKKQGPVAVIECFQEIPCNPCEDACPSSAINIGQPITNCPTLLEDRCTGCGICVAKCPGLAIFIVNAAFSEEEGTIDIPYEYPDVPEQGEVVDALNRRGEIAGEAVVLQIQCPSNFDKTLVVRIRVPLGLVDTVRNIRRKN